MKKIKEFFRQYKDYITVDLIMYTVMVVFIIAAVIAINIWKS